MSALDCNPARATAPRLAPRTRTRSSLASHSNPSSAGRPDHVRGDFDPGAPPARSFLRDVQKTIHAVLAGFACRASDSRGRSHCAPDAGYDHHEAVGLSGGRAAFLNLYLRISAVARKTAIPGRFGVLPGRVSASGLLDKPRVTGVIGRSIATVASVAQDETRTDGRSGAAPEARGQEMIRESIQAPRGATNLCARASPGTRLPGARRRVRPRRFGNLPPPP